MLVANGHRHFDILDYTLAQFRRYVELAQLRERRFCREQIMTTLIGFTGGETAAQALKALKD